MNKNDTVNILGIPLYRYSISTFIKNIDNKSKENKCISATGAHGLVTSVRDNRFREILLSFNTNLPDGMPGVWVGRLKGAKEMKRCYGPDFFEETMRASANSNLTHYLCGGNEGVADSLKEVCENKFGANIVGTFCPPFLQVKDYDYEEIAEQINQSNADIVWIGLSSPKQEAFASNLSKFTSVSYICCVGAAFDFHIGNVKQAPNWIQKIGMEWFFRLLMEPKRLWKRYIEIVPLFIYYNFAELIKGNFFKD
ncbi:WecB/TagA/CpsF family glycosyltransferase [Ekhidna sp.]|uniref:WecB/TagA/CpsF family glycosyltransferase n=1 Tax=Ekhidna sp. TaxID=2608089 RepID=UPI003CCBE15E